MKLKWVAAATIAATGGAAQAQSSVTLYGVLDSGLMYQSTSAASFNPASKNLGKLYRFKDAGIYSSNFGMTGTEDIGGGYRVNFKLQGTFDTGTGKSGLTDTPGVTAAFNQVTTVGMSGPFGSLNAGRQFAPLAFAMAETDVRGGKWFGSILTSWLGMNQAAGWNGTSTNGPIGALYDSNAIVYESPSFYGVKACSNTHRAASRAAFGNTRESAVLKYSGYGLRLSAAYYNGHDTNPGPTTVPNGLDNNRLYYVGALYTFHDISVSASYTKGKNPARSNQVDIDMYTAGLGYLFTPAFRVTSGIYYLKDNNNSANKSTEVAAGAEYSVSKTTWCMGNSGM